MKNTVLVTIALFFSMNLQAQQTEFGWLSGTWKMINKNVYEIWNADPDQKSLKGKSFSISQSDTTVLEEIHITHSDGSFYYTPVVKENNGPVSFRVTRYDATSFVAENPQHDFPKIIRYRLTLRENKETMEAAVEGDGKVIHYYFEKVE
jgi:hypothetical protein